MKEELEKKMAAQKSKPAKENNPLKGGKPVDKDEEEAQNSTEKIYSPINMSGTQGLLLNNALDDKPAEESHTEADEPKKEDVTAKPLEELTNSVNDAE